MLTVRSARRLVAALTAGLVAVLLVALGGTTHAAPHAQQSAAGAVHLTSSPLLIRAPHVDAAGVPHAVPHLDLASTPPAEAFATRAAAAPAALSSELAQYASAAVAPIGRAPPTV